MARKIFMLLMIMTVISIGCSRKESLEKYSDVITKADLDEIMSYSDNFEKQVQKSHDGVHLTFSTDEYVSSNGREGYSVLVVHLEYMVVDVKEFKNDMKDREIVGDIGDYAWYDNFGNGYNEIIFYTSDKNIIVQMGGYIEGSDHDRSTFIDKEALLELANIVESRL